MTGDASVNRNALFCAARPRSRQYRLHDGENAAVHDVIMDEFHTLDGERGVARVPCSPCHTLASLSATLGDTAFFGGH